MNMNFVTSSLNLKIKKKILKKNFKIKKKKFLN